ncbi:hypothetical protein PHISCL_00958 [Aspergillus sclerotialis]|uniref:Ubiquitin conjugating enzyme n=1 Tax=Aspergillus sclerotialis TaxID=2070753 RepID=A0A3A2ZZC3_9EURO|nr:hypothetical protein PHISCL_00958 [Aspergillus sclerotialis]
MGFTTLVRRGTEYASNNIANGDQKLDVKASPWLIALFAVTLVAVLVAFWAVEYTYGAVVATLATIEDSTPAIYVRIDSDVNPNKGPDSNPESPETAGTPAKPITSSLRGTVRHLRNRAGPWSRFRGFSLFLVYGLGTGILSSMFSGVPANYFLIQFFVDIVVSGVLLAPLQLAWVHAVISEPSPKRWYQRIPSYKSWTKIVPAAVFEQTVVGAAFFLPLALAKGLGGWEVFNSSPDMPPAKAACHAFAVVAGPSLLAFLVAIPARAIFVRVAASMLPEEDEAIVPFDRTFGGKVAPAILGGSGKLGIVDAWKTFDRPAFVRYVKVIFKVFAIEVALIFAFTLVLVGEVYAIGGDAMHKMSGAMTRQG